jgi:hypothetical protein
MKKAFEKTQATLVENFISRKPANRFKFFGWFSLRHISITSFMTLKTTKKNLMTLEEFKEKNFGKRGTTDW